MKGSPDVLLSVESQVAEAVEMHETKLMKMTS
jgi:hypothetical protein